MARKDLNNLPEVLVRPLEDHLPLASPCNPITISKMVLETRRREMDPNSILHRDNSINNAPHHVNNTWKTLIMAEDQVRRCELTPLPSLSDMLPRTEISQTTINR
jgi:hypothetical protein